MNKVLIALIVGLMPASFYSQSISIDPDEGNAGQTLDVSITGSNTTFLQGSGTYLDFEFDQGSPTSINSLDIVSNELMNANITIPANTVTGDYDVLVWNLADGDILLEDGFFVNGSPAPELISVDPDEGAAGQTLDVTITGVNTNFLQGSGTSVDFEFSQGSSSVNFFNVLSNTEISANVTIPSSTPNGTYDVWAYNLTDGDLVLEDGFLVGVTNVEELAKRTELILYPNPANDYIVIKASDSALIPRKISITDNQGRVVLSIDTDQFPESIDIGNLPKGNYFILVDLESTILMTRFQK